MYPSRQDRIKCTPQGIADLCCGVSISTVYSFQSFSKWRNSSSNMEGGKCSTNFKMGSRTAVGNNGPASHTSVCCIQFEKIVWEAILIHMIENMFLTNSQYGLVMRRSCTTQFLQAVNRWIEVLDRGGAVDEIYSDFTKAFDSVPYQRLLLKMERYGVTGKVLEWIFC